MKHIDITIDFEALALTPTAAPMSMAAVAWNRDDKKEDGTERKEPFLYDTHVDQDNNTIRHMSGLVYFQCGIDVRSCIIEGLTVDQNTLKWWADQSADAKGALLLDQPIWLKDAINNFLIWVKTIREKCEANTVCLWSQGSDYDIAILRNICSKLDIDISDIFDFHNFRDCRSVICENVTLIKKYINDKSAHTVMEDNSVAYTIIPDIPGWVEGTLHSPLYDCIRSTWATWHSMNLIRDVLESV